MGMLRGAWERARGLKTWAEGCAAKPACAGWGWGSGWRWDDGCRSEEGGSRAAPTRRGDSSAVETAPRGPAGHETDLRRLGFGSHERAARECDSFWAMW